MPFGIDITSLTDDPNKKDDASALVNQAQAITPATPPPPNPNPPANSTNNNGFVLADDPKNATAQIAQLGETGIAADISASQKNVAAMTAYTQASQSNYNTTIQAYDNLRRINRWGGENTPIAKILGFFDSDWNANVQRINVQEATEKQTQLGVQLKTQLDINEQIPALVSKMEGFAQKNFTNLVNLNQDERAQQAQVLAEQAGQRDAARLMLEKVKTQIDLSQEQRAAQDRAVANMSLEQKQVALQDAKTNPNSRFKSIGGALEKGIADEQAAEVALHNSQNAAANGDIELQQKSLSVFAHNLPTSHLAPLVEQALQKGDAMITLGQGKDAVQLPVPIAMQALNDNQKAEQSAQQTLIQDETNRLALPERVGAATVAARGMASIDPEAGANVKMLNYKAQELGPNPTFQQVQAFSQTVKAIEDRNAAIAEKFASNFQSKDAQGAVKEFGKTGTFSSTGAQAVLSDSIGNYSLQKTTKYSGAFALLNTQVATALKQSQMNSSTSLSPNMDGASIIAALNAGKKNPKLNEIRDNVLNDPTVMQGVANSVKGTITKDSLVQALVALANQKGANPTWQSILQNQGEYSSGNGSSIVIDPTKLAIYLEKQSVLSGGKVNFNQTFMNALRAVGANADQNSNSDPNYTVYDHALETTIFGGKPHSAVVGDFLNSYSRVASRAHQEMAARVNADRSGQTTSNEKRDALNDLTVIPGIGPVTENSALYPTDNMMRKSVSDVTDQNTPSATGIGSLTVQELKSLYGGR